MHRINLTPSSSLLLLSYAVPVRVHNKIVTKLYINITCIHDGTQKTIENKYICLLFQMK